MLGSLVFNGPISVVSQALTMLPETEIIPEVYSLDIHSDIQLNICLNIHHVLYIFGVCVKRIVEFVMRYEAAGKSSLSSGRAECSHKLNKDTTIENTEMITHRMAK